MLMPDEFDESGLRDQNVTRLPSGENPSVLTDGFTSSRAANFVRL